MTHGLLTSRPPPMRGNDGERATVLVIDDDRIGAERVRLMIEAQGHEVILARTWTEALQAFTSRDLDLILMDAVMPTVDGFKLTRIFRERARSYVPIVFLTGLTDQRARRRSVEAGADDLLTKPVDELELSLRLVTMLRIRGLTRALEEKSRALAELARLDALTGLLNRRVLDARLPKEVARARRRSRDLAVLMLDVDHFKRINDGFGHETGDFVLVTLGRVMRDCLRGPEQAYRYGGEEIVVIAPGCAADAASELAERIRATFRERTAAECTAGAQTLSVGIAAITDVDPAADGPALQAAADRALYRAKRSGRDRACVYAREQDD